MTMVTKDLLAMSMYPWVPQRRRLSFQYVMAEVSVHYYGWIRHMHDERVMSPTSDLVLLFCDQNFGVFE